MSMRRFLDQQSRTERILEHFWKLGTVSMALENRIGLNIRDLVGGPGGVRTLDLMTASHARSQLRHRPLENLKTPCTACSTRLAKLSIGAPPACCSGELRLADLKT